MKTFFRYLAIGPYLAEFDYPSPPGAVRKGGD